MAALSILVLNSGSSSIKFSVFGTGNGEARKLHEGAVDSIGTDTYMLGPWAGSG
jgi:acetate kinase